MPQTILGIDIGSYSVKIAQIKRTFKNFELVKFYEHFIQYNELLTPEESTTAAITAILEDNALAWDQAIVGLPGQYVSSRLITLPFGSKKKIDQTIEFELENHIPFELANVVTDYHIIKSTKESSKVLAMYATKGQFVKYLTLVENAGIDPKIVCVEGVELVNLVNLGMVPPDGVYALVDLGHKKTTVTICKGKSLIYTRTIMLGGWHITDSIAKRLNVPFEEAEKLKIEMGQAALEDTLAYDDLTKKVLNAIKVVAEDLILHLRQTFFSYLDEEGEAVSGIYLSGGTSRLPGIDRFLSVRLKQNVAFLDCLEFHFSRLSASEVHLQLIPQALALALRAVAPAGLPDVNFRRGEFAYKGDVKQIGGGIRRAGLAIGFAILLAIFYFGVRYYTLSKRLTELNKEVATLVQDAIPDVDKKKITTAPAALSTVKARRVEVSDKLTKFSTALASSGLDTLKDVSESFPPKEEVLVDVDKLAYTYDKTDRKIVISGRTDSQESVDKIEKAMKDSKKFQSVKKEKATKGVKDEIKFELVVELAEK